MKNYDKQIEWMMSRQPHRQTDGHADIVRWHIYKISSVVPEKKIDEIVRTPDPMEMPAE